MYINRSFCEVLRTDFGRLDNDASEKKLGRVKKDACGGFCTLYVVGPNVC